MERMRDLLVQHHPTVKVLGLALALAAMVLAGIAADPWPGG